MHAPDKGHVFLCKFQNRAKLAVVYSRSDNGNQHNAQTGVTAVLYGSQLFHQKRAAAKNFIHLVGKTVELEKNAGQSGTFQKGGVARLICQTKAVCVKLEKGEALFNTHGDNLRKIVPHCGFSPGKLEIIRPAGGHEHIHYSADVLKSGVFTGGLTGRGKAYGTF